MLPARVRAAVFARSFAVQGTWNYRTLLGPGFAFALLPALRFIYRDRPEEFAAAVDRHSTLFNCHPYLAPMALAAVATMEEEGEDPAITERFKAAVRGSLGTMGDRLIWAGWRPVCLLASLALLLAGAAWWVVVIAFLAAYNAGHLLLRTWSFRIGWAQGKRVGERLRASPVASTQRSLSIVGSFLVGLVLPLVVTGRLLEHEPGPLWSVVAIVAAVAGVRWGSGTRNPVIAGLGIVAAFGVLLGIME